MEEGKHLKAQGGEEPQHKGETIANRCVIDMGRHRLTTVNSAKRRTQFATSAENKNTLSEYANPPK